ncbi:MAG: 23S rRNA (uracil(1939)-C(5))-methyltransferase RlmD [Magnetococcales bacterium]|nr:23S rRNA (uracil(1939)-C(5))-methyltransferase RlmD [Magnetococcales bacterium]
MPDQEVITLQIEKMVPQGLGLGFHAGTAVFVPFTAPGDRILAEVTSQKAGHWFARCVQILEPGPERIDPTCALFTRCGGCQLRHLSGSFQRTIKETFIRETLTRFPNLREVIPLATEASTQTEGYRCRAGFKVRWVGSRLLLGFFQTASHHIADLTTPCPVLDARLDRLLAPLRQLIADLAVRHRLPQVDAVVGESGIGLIFHLLAAPAKRDLDALRQFAHQQGVVQLWLQRGRKTGMQSLVHEAELFYRVEPHTLTFHPGDFIQAHQAGNRLLVDEAMRQGGTGAVAWDLFCGVGNFTLPLTQRFTHVLGVEGYAPTLQRATANAAHCQTASVHFRSLDLFQEQEVARLATEQPADLVLLDPPREGALALVKWLVTQPVRRLVYVSCNPATFARDAAILVHGGFGLQRVQPIDLFPQTAHVELVALFGR